MKTRVIVRLVGEEESTFHTLNEKATTSSLMTRASNSGFLLIKEDGERDRAYLLSSIVYVETQYLED